jgi:prepilin-type N-terminal cleavage/methylation domain-containing protein
MKKMLMIKKNTGFTLMETLVTIFIFGLLMAGTTLMLKAILVNSRQQSLGLGNVDQARRIASTFVSELRNSAYGINGAYPVSKADDTEIVFYSTTPKNNGTVSRIRYYMSGGILYKGIIHPSGSPLSYVTSTETITPLISTLSLGANPLFYYYDGNYNGSTSALAQPVNLNQIKFVKINLIVLKQDVQNNTTTSTITAGAALRNLKTNLGN